MPVKRRVAKRRLSAADELWVWESVFDSGRDFFGELKDIGVETDAYGVPDIGVAREAWLRLGRSYLLKKSPETREPWAVRTFGHPPCQ